MAGDPGEVGIHGPEVSWDSLHSLDVATGEVAQITDLQAVTTQVGGPVRCITLVGGTARGVVFNVLATDPTDSRWTLHSVWYAESGSPPRKLADGEWEVPFGVATCGDTLAGFVRDIRVRGDYSLWSVGPDGPAQLHHDILTTKCPGEEHRILELLTWDSERVFAVVYGRETSKSWIVGFAVREE